MDNSATDTHIAYSETASQPNVSITDFVGNNSLQAETIDSIPFSNLALSWTFGPRLLDPLFATMCLLKAQSSISALVAAHATSIPSGTSDMKWTYGNMEFRFSPCEGTPIHRVTYSDILDVTRGFFNRMDMEGPMIMEANVREVRRAADIAFAWGQLTYAGLPSVTSESCMASR